MIYSIKAPCTELRGVVSYFWVGSWDASIGNPNNTHYVIANRLTEITFAFNGKEPDSDLVFSTIQGHTHHPKKTIVPEFYHLIGVSFNSFALQRTFKTPAIELSNESMSIETFLGSKGRMLNDMIASPNTTEKRIKIVSDFLIAMLDEKAQSDHLILSSIADINNSHGGLRIEELAEKYCLSEKQFSRRFKYSTGFSPKVFSRITRFDAAISNHENSSNLTELAQKLGYFDQSHFNSEFKSFSGFSPKDFWKLNQ
jgi:AraC-like DNA-binding protein